MLKPIGENKVLPKVSEINCDCGYSHPSGEYLLDIKNTSVEYKSFKPEYEILFARELKEIKEEININNSDDMDNLFYGCNDKYNCSDLKENTELGNGKKREVNKKDYMLFENGGNVIENQDSYYTSLNGMKLPYFIENVADKLNFYQKKLRKMNLNGINNSVLSKLENITLKEIGKQSNKLLNNLNNYVYPKDKYTQVDNQRNKHSQFCQNTLIKNSSQIFPANEILTPSENKAILSEYPLHTKEELNQYLKMLLNENIDVVYILSDKNEIFNYNDIKSIERNNVNNNSFMLDGGKFKYFKYFDYFMNNNDVAVIGNSYEKKQSEMYDNYPIINFELYTNNVSDRDKEKYIKFVHINNWRAGTLMDPFILENTIKFIEKEKLETDNYNFLIHGTDGMNRTSEFFVIKEIMDTINNSGENNQSLEDIIHQLKADRSPHVLNSPEILIELAAYALAKGIPLVK
ncbi:protein-tyrosine phosphatase family protein [Proteus columbae]|uniref:protein-tyrosine phosphatase family protein n=1 Tax=Proteus columbae TaxID=1987580 RepID=UPI0034D5B9EF